MNRTTFLFLALLIVSCIVTVNSRHEARTLITQKTLLTEKVTALQESIRRLELANARFSAKTCPLPPETVVPSPRAVVPKATPAAEADGTKSVEPKVAASVAPVKVVESTIEDARPTRRTPAKAAVVKDEDAMAKAIDRALKQ